MKERPETLDPEKLLEDPLYSTRQIAKMTGVTTETVRAWIHSGKLEAFRLGPRTLKVRRSVLMNFLNSKYGSTTPTAP